MSTKLWLEEAWPDQAALAFSRFMELCLYHPQLGYYERDRTQIGAQGDFITSVSAGPLFGQLLAFQFTSWLEEMAGPSVLVEAGAHDGTLARDILESIASSNAPPKLEYWIIEPSLRRQHRQQRHLEKFAGRVRWVRHLGELPPVHGVIFSNELLDAFPVRRLGWSTQEQAWFEWGVVRSEDKLEWARLALAQPEAVSMLQDAGLEWSDQLGRVLPNDYTLDLCPAAGVWWDQAASLLQAGRLMTIDYGLLADELLAPHRTQGTLRAYGGHHQFSDVLSEPGQRDLTAHINFTQLIRAGEKRGLRTLALSTQERFLMDIAQRMNASQPEVLSGQAQALQTLVHPDRQPFRVLVQGPD